MANLTIRQQEILDYLVDHTIMHGFQPSYEEQADFWEMSGANSVRSHFRAIEKKGAVHLEAGRPRAVKIVGWKNIVKKRVAELV